MANIDSLMGQLKLTVGFRGSDDTQVLVNVGHARRAGLDDGDGEHIYVEFVGPDGDVYGTTRFYGENAYVANVEPM